MTVSHPRSISSNSKLESLAAASMEISTQEGGTSKRRNLSLRCNSEANSSGTESQGPPFTAHFGYAGLASPVTDVASDRGSARRAEKAKTEKEAEDGL